ncbi:MAG: thiol oxidoreductase [Planctomycetes bacterium]|nr:thiol oxidoreductase [Planctomycetota bacterium]
MALSRPSSLVARAVVAALTLALPSLAQSMIGREVSVRRHLQDGDEFAIRTRDLIRHGEDLFAAMWTAQEGAGRPLTKGTGAPIADPSSPLVFPRAFNRISANDANSCAGCHNAPYGIAGGGGDFVTGVFVLGQRFDFATFDHTDPVPTRGSVMENGQPATMQTIANYRATLGMAGSGYVELLAREITADLQAIRNSVQPGGSAALVSKGISYGRIARFANGNWDVSGVVGLPAPSVAVTGGNAPNLIVRPFHQAGAVISLRQFSNNAFNHHHGIQTTERFGAGTDVDGDSFANEMTRADVTAVSVFQATMAVPGRVIPRDRQVEAAVSRGERLFTQIGCADCHIPALPLRSSLFTEPNPYNPAGNLQPGQAPNYVVDLNNGRDLPSPRLDARHGVTMVPVFTDFKLHNICAGPGDPNGESLDMHAAPSSPAFFAGNQLFLTKKLWGAANEPPYFHHGQFTTMREAVLAHDGDARQSKLAFVGLSAGDKDCVIEMLKTLQVLRPGTRGNVVDERGNPRHWQSNF